MLSYLPFGWTRADFVGTGIVHNRRRLVARVALVGGNTRPLVVSTVMFEPSVPGRGHRPPVFR